MTTEGSRNGNCQVYLKEITMQPVKPRNLHRQLQQGLEQGVYAVYCQTCQMGLKSGCDLEPRHHWRNIRLKNWAVLLIHWKANHRIWSVGSETSNNNLQSLFACVPLLYTRPCINLIRWKVNQKWTNDSDNNIKHLAVSFQRERVFQSKVCNIFIYWSCYFNSDDGHLLQHSILFGKCLCCGWAKILSVY